MRAMFVAAFEAVKATSPLRDAVRDQLRGASTKIEAGLLPQTVYDDIIEYDREAV